MFDLDMIERDWLNNSFRLTEKEIMEIYRSENITLNKYYEEIKEYKKNTHVEMSAEDRLLRTIFGHDKEIIERENELRKQYEFPVKKRLSLDMQRKVVEGSLHMVFDSTRYWYDVFDGKISMEQIYYVCLEALMNSVKYMLHCEKPVFGLYVSTSIERNITKYIAKWEHITYKQAYEFIQQFIWRYCFKKNVDKQYDIKTELLFEYNNREEPEKPSKIFNHLKNEIYDVDYIKNISSDEFMKDYISSLDNLDDIARMVMQMSFDIEGNRGLTNAEIADYLGIESTKVSNIRKKAIKTLRKDIKLSTYYRC